MVRGMERGRRDKWKEEMKALRKQERVRLKDDRRKNCLT